MKENQIESYQKCLLILKLSRKKRARHSVLKIDVCATRILSWPKCAVKDYYDLLGYQNNKSSWELFFCTTQGPVAMPHYNALYNAQLSLSEAKAKFLANYISILCMVSKLVLP